MVRQMSVFYFNFIVRSRPDKILTADTTHTQSPRSHVPTESAVEFGRGSKKCQQGRLSRANYERSAVHYVGKLRMGPLDSLVVHSVATIKIVDLKYILWSLL
jgi:hypothetical protein